MFSNIEELEKRLEEIKLKLKPVEEEFLYHTRGFQFSSVRPVSARDLFGENWQLMIGNYMDAEQLFIASEKDQLKPVDIMLASVYSEREVKLKKGKPVNIIVSSGDNSYNGTHIAISVKGNDIVIPFPKKGDAQGIYQNTDKLEYLTNRKQKFEDMLRQINEEISGKADEQNTIHQPVMEDDGEGEPSHEQAKQKQSFRLLTAVVVIVAVTGIVLLLIPGKKEVYQTA